MAVADYYPLVQQLYVAYFGRPADKLGLENFATALSNNGAPTTAAGLSAQYNAGNGTVRALVDQFGTSAESNALYTGDTLNFVNAIYQNLFNRSADVAGLTFWANAINTGALSRGNAALSIAAGAASNTSAQGVIDAAIVANKITVATHFTDAINTAPELLAYVGNAAAATARAMLAQVTNTTDTTTFQTTVEATLDSIVNTTVANGTTYTLTTGADNIVGTAQNDTINGTWITDSATTSTYQLTDQIAAGTGTDTLNLLVAKSDGGATGNVSVPAATVSGVEIVNVRATSGTASDVTTVAASNFAGATQINADRATSAVTVTGLATGAAAGMIGNGSVTNGDLTFGYATATDAATLNISGGTKAGNIAISSTPAAVTINSTGAANTVGTVALGGAATGLTVTAATNLKTGAITGFTGTAAKITVAGTATTVDLNTLENTTVATVDASGLTAGGITATLNTNVALKVTGGAGNDSITTGAVLTTGSVDAGAGTGDRLVIANSTHVTSVTGGKYTNFEILRNNAAATQDASVVAGITSVELGASGAGFSKLTATQAAAVTNLVDNNNATISLTDATGSADVLTVTLKNATAANSADLTGLTITGFETLNVVSSSGTQGKGTPGNDLSFAAAAQLGAINVSGAYDLAISTTNLTKAVAIASTQTGTANLSVSGNLVKGSSVVTTGNADTITTTAAITGGAGDFVTYDAGAGNDSITSTLAAINNTSSSNGSLKIEGGAGTDTLTLTDTNVTAVDANFQYLTGIEKIVFSGTQAGAFSLTTGGFFDNNFKTSGLDLTLSALNGKATTVTASTFTGALTVTATNATGAATTIVTGTGADKVTVTNAGTATTDIITVQTGAGADTITINSGATGANATIVVDGGAGADVINLATRGAASTHNQATITVGANDSTTSAFDKVTGFRLADGTNYSDKLDLSGTATVAANATAQGVTGYTSGELTYSVTGGILSFAGTKAAALTNAEKINIAQLVITSGSDTVAFVDATAGDTYVFHNDAAGDTVVQLVGVSATSLNGTATTATANALHIA